MRALAPQLSHSAYRDRAHCSYGWRNRSWVLRVAAATRLRPRLNQAVVVTGLCCLRPTSTPPFQCLPLWRSSERHSGAQDSSHNLGRISDQSDSPCRNGCTARNQGELVTARPVKHLQRFQYKWPEQGHYQRGRGSRTSKISSIAMRCPKPNPRYRSARRSLRLSVHLRNTRARQASARPTTTDSSA